VKNYVTYKEKYLLGDVHGDWGVILRHLQKVNDFDFRERSQVAYIQVGDFGIGYNTTEIELKKLLILNSELESRESDLYIIRGNHDDPDWFEPHLKTEFKEQLSNIFFVPDYTVLNIDFENILFIGGAVSIDRNYNKIKGGKYWPDEVVKFDFDFAKNIKDIERIICHTAPDFVDPLTFGTIVYKYAMSDDLLLSDLRTERENMSKLINEIMVNNKIKNFTYGHFHRNYRSFYNDCEFLCLDVNNFKSF
jgi:hypothetical protein